MDSATLRSFITTAADANLVEEDHSFSLNWSRSNSDSSSVKFCQALCELLVRVRDPTLVNLFFAKCFSRLDEKKALIPSVTKIIRAFKWSDIAQGLLNSLDEKIEESSFGFMGHYQEVDDSGMEVALRLVDTLDDGVAQQALLKATVEKAVMLRDERLCLSNVIGLL